MKHISILVLILLTACNSVYIKPNATLDTSKPVYANRGGFTMKRVIKQELEKHGFTVKVGRLKSSYDGDDISIETEEVPGNHAYIVRVSERSEVFRPLWCVFNGFWWWRFNVSIVDQDTKNEIVSWRGRGCANSSVRKLDDILNKLEQK